MTRFLTEAEVQQCLTMPEAIEAVEWVMGQHAEGAVVDLPRQRVRLPGSITHLLQGAVPALDLTGFKVYTSTREGTRFWVHLYRISTGEPVAVLAADWLGMMRTGATGGVAIRHLARSDAQVLTLFGSGWQAEGQVRAAAAVRAWQAIRVVSRRFENAQQFCARLEKELSVPMVPFAPESAAEALAGADVVVTATTSVTPVFDAAWIRPGMHINAIGSNSLARQEIPEKTVVAADRIVVDSRAVALKEAGDLLPAREKGRTRPELWVELGEVLAGIRPGRRGPDAITLFESQGMAIQDIAVAARVLERATALGLGSELPY
ncbi:ornithine cyclodeaminase [Hydrogenophilus thermoluteolus]|uniref:ornithine cyclodeaminase family protein n=1 Tax=Hydrogenophilus thermoluteolus TaxID=297 RepID=UPI00249FDD0B|nr:ornithine cyclodeaminase family protein [Hydrogenophilus thermoluteolus]GLW59996.1 ornithine cyclodeaminase [Hydrogenophilus thermoluteolus]